MSASHDQWFLRRIFLETRDYPGSIFRFVETAKDPVSLELVLGDKDAFIQNPRGLILKISDVRPYYCAIFAAPLERLTRQ